MKVWDSLTAKAVTKAEEKAMATSPCVSWTPLARMSEGVGQLQGRIQEFKKGGLK